MASGCDVFNNLTFEQSAKAAREQVLSQIERRADLIASLVESVIGVVAYERTGVLIFVSIAERCVEILAITAAVTHLARLYLQGDARSQ